MYELVYGLCCISDVFALLPTQAMPVCYSDSLFSKRNANFLVASLFSNASLAMQTKDDQFWLGLGGEPYS